MTMKKRFKKTIYWLKNQLLKIKPGQNAIKGASKTLLVVVIACWLIFLTQLAFSISDPWFVLFGIVLLLLFLLSAFLIIKVVSLLNKIPKLLKVALFVSIPLLFFMLNNPILAIGFIVIVSLIGASLFVFKKTGFKSLTNIKKIVLILGILLGVGGLVFSFISYNTVGYDVDKMVNAAEQSIDNIEPLQLESPASLGAYTVKQLT